MPKSTRDPAYDLQRHIVTGERGPLSGDSFVRDIDNDKIDHNDPMMFSAGSGVFGSKSSGEILAANAAQAVSLDSGAGMLGTEIDVQTHSDNHGNPGEATDLSYGPRNIGGR